MITGTVLSAFTNLFALFCTRSNVNVEVSSRTLLKYLNKQYGVTDTGVYLDTYKDLMDLYATMPELDLNGIVNGICSNIKSEITQEEQLLVFLRLMEFCSKHTDNTNPDEELFEIAAKSLNISDEHRKLFADYFNDSLNDAIKITKFNGLVGKLKTMYIRSLDLLIFTYSANDASHVLYNNVPVNAGMFQIWHKSGVVKDKHVGTPIYYSSVIAIYNEEETKNDIVFSGRDINFRFPDSDNGMHNFSFDLHSGELLAIMGGSGSGKTTLVSILNGNIKPQTGTITINGHSIDEPGAKALIGFVPQDDLLIEELTVYQNLYYTAKLCFNGMSEQEIDRRVIKILRELGLEQAKDLKVGSPINKFISGGQRKRLNIALELIREPAVLFLDEPTSGLSSSDTEKVVLLLKEQTSKGRLVITNIHQPSSDVYKLFDHLWLLDRGGYPVYDGDPFEAIKEFKSKVNYPDEDAIQCPTCGSVTPELLLNIIEEVKLDTHGQPTDERKYYTPKQWHQMYLDKRGDSPAVETSELPETNQHKPNKLTQWYIFLKRNIATKITNAQYLAITLFEAPLLALVCALLTHYSPAGQDYSIMNNKNLVSYLFMAIIVATFSGMSGSAEEIIKDRALLKREKFLQLSYHAYIWSKVVFMAIVALIQTFLFIAVGNFVMGITDIFFVWWLIMFATAFLAALTGLVLSQCLSSVVAIYITIPILLIPQILLCGLVVNFNDLTPNSTTGNVPAIGNIIPSRWAYEALAVTSYTDNAYEAPLFIYDKEKYETEYYRHGFIYTLQSAVESMQDEKNRHVAVNPQHMLVLKTELPTVAAICDIKPYSGKYDYKSLHDYLAMADSIMLVSGNKATLTADNIMQELISENGKDYLTKLKSDHFNLNLQSQLAGEGAKDLCEIVDGHIVPRAGFVYLTPRTSCGNAPFYSCEKRIGNLYCPTLWYNLAVMALMMIIVMLCLLYDIPGRYMRKN